MAKSTVSMKLLIDTQAKRVLFAEASKDCTDFLFHILAMPVANIISLLKKQGMVGSLANLYESIENLNESYIQPNKTKDTLLKPALMHQVSGSSVPLLLLYDAPTVKKFYKCGGYNSSYNCNYLNYVSDDPRAVCPSCNQIMTANVSYVAPPSIANKACDEGGFVKGVVTYMIMDNLEVKPMSTISSIILLNKFNVKDVGALEEKVVNLGMNEAVKLLKASLQSKNVLTDVFLS
ncbi:hypothetical protein BUALT_Bualt13G0070400 [Buddleja alternifolia]|uniref:DUF674 domain-containing protein n=1 Tax=Buddleja alternifolia TaxID=168488 RepID=A0AAV6WWD1_9LAMI|nr:hypothetical protein BUALT_Bualt13G0070400 [Buddleja alternifolia]